MLRYDESTLLDRLQGAPSRARALFAALSAERLLPLYEEFARSTGRGDPERLRAALDAAWSALDGDAGDLARWAQIAEDLVPAEDEHWVTATAYAENAAAAVAYALSAQLSGDPQMAVLPARQAYEATDFAAQRQLEHVDYGDPGAEDAYAGQPVVQEALRAIDEDLAAALEDAPPEAIPSLRKQARREGETLAERVK